MFAISMKKIYSKQSQRQFSINYEMHIKGGVIIFGTPNWHENKLQRRMRQMPCSTLCYGSWR